MSNYRCVCYNIFDVKLYSVEKNGYIFKYCDDKNDAQGECDALNQKHLTVKESNNEM